MDNLKDIFSGDVSDKHATARVEIQKAKKAQSELASIKERINTDHLRYIPYIEEYLQCVIRKNTLEASQLWVAAVDAFKRSVRIFIAVSHYFSGMCFYILLLLLYSRSRVRSRFTFYLSVVLKEEERKNQSRQPSNKTIEQDR